MNIQGWFPLGLTGVIWHKLVWGWSQCKYANKCVYGEGCLPVCVHVQRTGVQGRMERYICFKRFSAMIVMFFHSVQDNSITTIGHSVYAQLWHRCRGYHLHKWARLCSLGAYSPTANAVQSKQAVIKHCDGSKGFPRGSALKNPPATSGDAGLIPGLGRLPGEDNGKQLQYSCLGNPMERGAWRATVHGVAKELEMI